MPLTPKGRKIMSSMKKEYGDKKGESVFYASRNKGKISGVDPESNRHAAPSHMQPQDVSNRNDNYDARPSRKKNVGRR